MSEDAMSDPGTATPTTADGELRVRASHPLTGDPTGGHPFPQLRRPAWVSLNGVWDFAYDDADRGRGQGWHQGLPAQAQVRPITVPYPPESAMSGIGETGYHPVVWYARRITAAQARQAGWAAPGDGVGNHAYQGERLLLHMGAVDYRASVWVAGQHVGDHEGGHVPFTLDITDALTSPAGQEQLAGSGALVVVRAEDLPLDAGQPRGKQDWRRDPHVIWYSRTSGIWQHVWIEAVPRAHVSELSWTPSRACDSVLLEAVLSSPAPGAKLEVDLEWEGKLAASASTLLTQATTVSLDIPLRHMVHGQQYEEFLWSPEHPRLWEARVRIVPADGAAHLSPLVAPEWSAGEQAGSGRACEDAVSSYLGLRSVGCQKGRFLLNDRPYYVRSVLEQGFWPDSHLAAPSDEALHDEVALIKSLGFNAARIHQKVEDPRFLYWADRLGLLVWGEIAAPYEYTVESVARLISEWTAAVRRDRAHPCVVTWVPINESWGVQHIGNRSQQQAFSRAISDLTRALDPSRPVVSNDGWEHTASDIITIHDYDSDNDAVRQRYSSDQEVSTLLAGFGPAGRSIMADGHAPSGDEPVMVSECGGIRYVAQATGESWGYTSATDAEDFEKRLRAVFEALHASPVLAGFCYTQITDTMQEANGLTDEHRIPKLPAERIAAIVIGNHPTGA